MMPLGPDKLLPKCQILEKESVMRAKEANQRSAAEFKETKHAAGYSRIVMQTKAAMLLIVIDSKVGRSFGEEQPGTARPIAASSISTHSSRNTCALER